MNTVEKDVSPLGSELKTAPNNFTPVRRKESTLNNGRLNRHVETEWTAARCNRLLRPLTSRIAILHKCKQSTLDRMKNASKKGKLASDSNMDASGQETKNDDANWFGQKKVKRTYSGKTGKKAFGKHGANMDSSVRVSLNSQTSSVAGEIIVPTPLLNRAWRKTTSPYRSVPFKGNALEACEMKRTNLVSNRLMKARPLGASKSQPLGSQALSKIRNTMRPARFNIYEGIHSGLETLLRVTRTTKSNNAKKGSKSLFHLCLDTVPKYIAVEEMAVSSEMERTGFHSSIEKRDISTEIYDDLELLGSSGKGWTHLQNVVRAHGIHIICDAILEGLLDSSFCEILVDLCIYSDHYDEAELILSSLLSICRFPAPESSESLFSDYELHRPLIKVRELVKRTSRNGFEYRQISILVQNGLLPLQWLATSAFTPIWTSLMQDLSLDYGRADAIYFTNTILPGLVEYVSLSDSWSDIELYKACRSTLLSVLTTISSIILLNREFVEKISLQKVEHTTISDTHLMLLKDCCSKTINSHTKENVLQNAILSLACLVTEPDADDTPDFVIDHLYKFDPEMNREAGAEILSSLAQKTVSAFNEAVRFISSVARCCGKGASTSGFEYLQHIHQRIEQLITSRGLKMKTYWHGIIVDSAFAFAQLTPGQRYLDYADYLDEKLHADSLRRPESTRKEAHQESKAFRWEEGISAWVTATPATNISKTKSITTNFESDELEREDEPELESPSILRAQPPPQLGQRIKRKYDVLENDRAAPEPEVIPSKSGRETRAGKAASFDIWHCDSSDDELNSSHESSQNCRLLKDVQNTATKYRSKLVGMKRQKESSTIIDTLSSFSEDELGI